MTEHATKFRVKADVNEIETYAQELEAPIRIKAGEVYETTVAGAARALRMMRETVEEIPAEDAKDAA